MSLYSSGSLAGLVLAYLRRGSKLPWLKPAAVAEAGRVMMRPSRPGALIEVILQSLFAVSGDGDAEMDAHGEEAEEGGIALNGVLIASSARFFIATAQENCK